MAREHPIFRLIWFCIKFTVLAVLLMWGWLTIVPYYGQFLVQACGGILLKVFHFPIIQGGVTVDGLLNFTSTIDLLVQGGRSVSSPFVGNTANVAPFVALVLATAGLGLWRRVWSLVLGLLILVGAHVGLLVYIGHMVLSVEPGGELPPLAEVIPNVAAQFMMLLPFLLWAVFAYWGRLAAALGNGADNAPPEAPKGKGSDFPDDIGEI